MKIQISLSAPTFTKVRELTEYLMVEDEEAMDLRRRSAVLFSKQVSRVVSSTLGAAGAKRLNALEAFLQNDTSSGTWAKIRARTISTLGLDADSKYALQQLLDDVELVPEY